VSAAKARGRPFCQRNKEIIHQQGRATAEVADGPFHRAGPHIDALELRSGAVELLNPKLTVKKPFVRDWVIQ
jgi:hypothetical protein